VPWDHCHEGTTLWRCPAALRSAFVSGLSDRRFRFTPGLAGGGSGRWSRLVERPRDGPGPRVRPCPAGSRCEVALRVPGVAEACLWARRKFGTVGRRAPSKVDAGEHLSAASQRLRSSVGGVRQVEVVSVQPSQDPGVAALWIELDGRAVMHGCKHRVESRRRARSLLHRQSGES
jgi:hypothetical protein